jgi:hypothetical protein
MWFEHWWTRNPRTAARVALFVVGIVAMVLGGAADNYWM